MTTQQYALHLTSKEALGATGLLGLAGFGAFTLCAIGVLFGCSVVNALVDDY